MDLKASFCHICPLKNNLIFAQDYNNLNVCCFENNTFTSIFKFNFTNYNICLLKNNDLIVIEQYELYYIKFEFLSE